MIGILFRHEKLQHLKNVKLVLNELYMYKELRLVVAK